VHNAAGAAVGVVVSSLLARTGAVRITRHAAAQPVPVAASVSQSGSSVKRRSVDGNGNGGGGNGGEPDPESQSSLSECLLQEQHQQQRPFVLPFKAFCVGFSIATLVLVALAVGKQNIPALQKPLAPGAALYVSRFCTVASRYSLCLRCASTPALHARCHSHLRGANLRRTTESRTNGYPWRSQPSKRAGSLRRAWHGTRCALTMRAWPQTGRKLAVPSLCS